MADEISTSSALARTTLQSLSAIEPEGRPADNRGLTVVVVNLPVTASASGVPQLRTARPVVRWMPALPFAGHRQRGRRIALTSVLLLLAGSAATWWVMPRRGGDEPVDAIRIMLPAPRPQVDRPEPDGAGRPDGPAADRATRITLAPSSRRGAAVRPMATAPTSGDSALAEIGDLPEVAAATSLALRSGVAQSWQANGLSGVAVAGPLQLEGSNVCRTVAVLADGGAGRQTVNSVRCMTRAGTWIRRAPADPGEMPASAAASEGTTP